MSRDFCSASNARLTAMVVKSCQRGHVVWRCSIEHYRVGGGGRVIRSWESDSWSSGVSKCNAVIARMSR